MLETDAIIISILSQSFGFQDTRETSIGILEMIKSYRIQQEK